MALSPNEEQLLIERHKMDTSGDAEYLRNVINIRQKEAARAKGIATHTGLSTADIYNNPELQTQNLISPKDFQRLRMDYPSVHSFLSNPENMAITRDQKNIKSLTELEDNSSFGKAFLNGVKGFARYGASFMQGLNKVSELTTERDVQQAQELFGEDYSLVNPEVDGKAISAKRQFIDWEAIRKSPWLQEEENQAPEDRWFKQLLLDFTQNTPQLIAQVLATYATGGVGGALFMGSQIAGSSYEQLTDEGVAPERAFEGGFYNAAMQAPLEQLSLSRWFKPAAKGVNWAKTRKFLDSVFTEGLTEALQQFPEEATSIWAKTEGLDNAERINIFASDFDNILKRAGYAGILGGMFGAAGGIGNLVLTRNVHKEQMQQHQAQIEQMCEMPVGKISPELLESFRNKEGDTIFVEASQLYNVHNQTQGGIIEDMGLDVQKVQEAAVKGEMVEVPIGTYDKVIMQNKPEVHESLKNDIAYSPDEITQNRLNVLNEKAIKQAKERVLQQDKELQAESMRLQNEMVHAGMKAEVARDSSALLVSMAKTQSTNPANWLKENAPEFIKQGLADGLEDFLMYNQAAMYRNPAKDIVNFVKNIISGKSGKSYFRVETNNSEKIDITSDTVNHVQKGTHPFSDEQWQIIVDNIDNIEKAYHVKGRRKQHGGQIVLAKINTPVGKAGVTFEIPDSGRVFVDTLFFSTDKKINQWMKTSTASEMLIDYSITPTSGKKNPMVLEAPEEVLSINQHSHSNSSIDIISQKLGIVKATYKQETKASINENKKESQEEPRSRGLQLPNEVARSDSENILTNNKYHDNKEMQSSIKENKEKSHRRLRLRKLQLPPVVLPSIDSNNIITNSTNIINQQNGILPKGSVGWIADGQTVIIKREGADATTVIEQLLEHYNSRYKIDKKKLQAEVDKLTKEWQQSVTQADIANCAQSLHNVVANLQSTDPAKWLRENTLKIVNEKDVNKLKIKYNQSVEIGKGKTACVIEIDPAILPFNTVGDVDSIRNWIVKNFKGKEVIIKNDGTLQRFTVRGLKASLKRSRDASHNSVYPVLDKLIENAVFEKFEQADENHERLKGQNIYYAAAKIGDEYFSIKFRIDLPVIKNLPASYKDHKTNKIDPLPYNGSSASKSSSAIRAKGSISNISIDVLTGKVKPSLIKDGILWQQTKGSIGWTEDGKAVIIMREGADASTVIHELLGHYASQYVIDMGAKKDAPAVLKQDRAALLAYAGVENWDEATPEQKRAAHEKWAQAAESYILEGKAPSLELQGVFSRFKKWLLNIYSKIKRSEDAIELTDEVRRVFDHLLATEEQIAQKQYVEGYYNYLPDSMLETLSEVQLARLDKQIIGARQKAEDLLTGKVLQVFTAERKEQIRQERERIYQESLAGLGKEPLYKAIALIESSLSGKSADSYKNAWSLARAYKQKEQSHFTGQKYTGKLSDEMCTSFDYLSELHGFSSGSELAAKILSAQPVHKAASARADAYIEEKFTGVAANKELLERLAREAVYNNEAEQLVAIELQIIGEAAQRYAATNERARHAALLRRQARLSAQDALEHMTIERAGRLQSFIAAERRAAEKAAVALARGDSNAAFEQKRIQLFNHAMVQQALSVRQRYEVAQRYLTRQKQAQRSSWHNERNFVQAAELLRRFGLARRDFDPASKSETLMQYITRQEQENPDLIAIAEWLEGETGSSNPRKQLSIGQYEDLVNAVKNIRVIDRIGADSDQLAVIELAGKSSNLLAQQLYEAAEQVKDKLVDEPGGPRSQSALQKAVTSFAMGNVKVTQLLLELDNLKDFGVWHQTFYRYVKQAADQKSELLRQVSGKLDEAFQAAGIDKQQKYRDSNNKKYIAQWGVSLSKADLRVIALNLGSQSNLERLLSRPPVGLEQAAAYWKEETIKEVLVQNLTEQDFKLVEKIWQAIDLYPEYNKMVTKMTGFALPRVQPQPVEFVLPSGKRLVLSGGYYPLKQDRRASIQAEMQAEKALGDFVGVLPFPNTGASKQRTRASYAVDLDFNNLFDNLQQVAHDMAFRPVMHDLNKMLRKQQVLDSIRRKLGEEGYQALRDWQKAVGRGSDSPLSKGWADPLLNWLRSRTVVASLLLRPGVILQNNANFTLYGNAVEGFSERDALAAYSKRGLADYIPQALRNTARAKQLRQFVYERSPMMRDKLDAPDFFLRELQGLVQQGNVLTRNFDGAVQQAGLYIQLTQDKLVEFGGNMLAWSDQLTDIPIWLGAYEKALSLGKADKEAAHFADTVIERSTGSGRLIDTSGLQRGSPAMRTMTMFTGFFNTQLNRWRREYKLQLQAPDVGRLFVFMLKQYLAFGILSALYAFKLPEEDKYQEWLLKEVALWPLGMVPVLGSGIKVAIEQALGFSSFGYSMSPIESQVSSAARAAKMLFKEAAQPEERAEAVATFAAFALRYPDQLNDWFFNAYDLVQNDVEFELTDLVRRRPQRER